MRVLVLGAPAFRGEQVCGALTADEPATQATAAGRRSPTAGLPRVQHDLATGTPAQLAELLAATRVDAVVNCAGRLSGTVVGLARANTIAVAALIEGDEPAGEQRSHRSPPGRPPRLVTLGSAAEYGVVERGGPAPEPARAPRERPCGVTKAPPTRPDEGAAAAGRVDGIVLRLFNPIGPGVPVQNVAGRAVQQIRDALAEGGDRIHLGPLGAYRDFVDVRDVASAVVAAVFADAPSEVVCNVGSGVAVPTRELIRLLAGAADFAGAIMEADPPSAKSPGVDWIAADLAHTAAVLRWAPRFDLAVSAQATWVHAAVTNG
ncbi:NAD(P)-dependent oxidoreductase [Micromonospora sp. CPCC 205371]|nr:NAD(P)-dependent oxidoreductase [Micromonospora sp. CPCC 205371]